MLLCFVCFVGFFFVFWRDEGVLYFGVVSYYRHSSKSEQACVSKFLFDFQNRDCLETEMYEINEGLMEFNGTSTCLGLFYDYMLESQVHCKFIFIFSVHFFFQEITELFSYLQIFILSDSFSFLVIYLSIYMCVCVFMCVCVHVCVWFSLVWLHGIKRSFFQQRSCRYCYMDALHGS